MQPLGPDDPRHLGDYRLLRQLGAGGMGQVYLGRTPGGRTVAVKTVRPELARDETFRARFRHEVAAARRVGGAWTAPVLDADTEGPQPWVATGYVAGPSLSSAVHQHGPLPGATVRLLGVGLAEALAHVHGLGLVHRDVKPSNVLLTLDGPRLIDFGIARALDATTKLTQTGHVIGSPGYMSPEQAQGRPAGPAGDVFSLGAVLALSATGRQPFGEGVGSAVLIYRVLHEQPDLAALDQSLRAVILGCLAKDPAARPTPEQLRSQLDPDGTAGARLGRSSWLSAELSAAVGRAAVQLLDLESDAPAPAAAPPAPVVPPIPTAAPIPAAPATSAPTGRYQPSVSAPVPPGPAHSQPVPYGYPVRSGPVAPARPTAVPTAPTERRGRGLRLAALVAAGVVAVALVGYGIVRLGNGDSDGSSSAGGGSSASATTNPPVAGAPAAGTTPPAAPPETGDPTTPSPEPSDRSMPPSVVPPAFLGTWEAEHAGADGKGKLSVLVGESWIGYTFAAQVRLTGSGGGYCSGAWTLTTVAKTQLRYTSRLTDSNNMQCGSNGERILDLQPDGNLRYSVAGGNATPLVLHKVS
ncbi:serine/threonine protein kinase [Kitasatospora xanthocidica]|uniref:serine/threonine-protein kinase n=1 Tax=Kitasatospora xanthocidica TaxID=83382 RepID=UPI001671C89A|nr:serine/threonine-protein kinase [Kitasatospora xanthocidica]GHF35237.1 serine/threonine protein kinase [Kitasatospora xanthocidica]